MLRSKKFTMGRHGHDMGDVVGVGAHMYRSALMKRNGKQPRKRARKQSRCLKGTTNAIMHVCEKQMLLDSERVLRNSRIYKVDKFRSVEIGNRRLVKQSEIEQPTG